ncbi:hypothetical protein FRC03_006231 [Tulasnella sp. 419]|nr:hypothetical protein FRC03_006231 [Tulasnella sp. 419]
MNSNSSNTGPDGSYRFGNSSPSAPIIAQSLPLTSIHPPSLARLTERRGSLPLSPIVASPPSDRDGSESGMESASSYHGTFYQRLRIEVNQPVGNMSISPANRDIVLGARKGLFIIDLEHPYETPRFLPQGGTWEVADVQWNPHPARANLIVSTSSQKLLIWDLYLSGQTSITRILNAHYRAITDVNWSSFEPDIIASCGIDSWIWAWDLRAGDRPIFGLSAWDAPATQVKWNRQDRHMLASSHDDKVLIWDDRKGSVPLTTIHAHAGAKIYGIDWSRKYRNEIVTCSLDKTIKFWKIDEFSRVPHSPLDRVLPDDAVHTARAVIHTKYPVWRARHLPFGHGILSLPQRGANTLEMYCPEQPNIPIYKAEGHTDVVKEYVWRTKGGDDPSNDDREFQLVTWSKDRTLRLWPIDASVMKAAAFVPGAPIKVHVPRRGAKNETFRDPPKPPDPQHQHMPQPTLSAPSASRGILAGVRAGVGVNRSRSGGPTGTSRHVSGHGTPDSNEGRPSDGDRLRRGTMDTIRSGLPESATPTQHSHIGAAKMTTTFMTRGKFAGGKPGTVTVSGLGVDTMGWFSAVKVEKLDTSGGSNGGDSGPVSRLVSRSRGASVDVNDLDERGSGRRSASQSINSDFIDNERPENLGDEIAMIGRKFGTRVTCERADVTKKRSCTFTLLGPWRDDSALTFIRISFEFPKDYWKPNADPLTSLPSFDLDKIVGISLKTRAFLLKKLKAIRVQRRPCLEPCLRFLLGEEEGGYGFIRSEGSATDDESEEVGIGIVGKSEDLAEDKGTAKESGILVKNSLENTPRPRRSQGVWGPNGELVCFFLTVPSKSYAGAGKRNASPSPSVGSRGTSGNVVRIRPFSSVAGTISHALRGLSRLTNDGSGVLMEPETRLKRSTPFMGTLFMGSMMRSSTRESRDTRASSVHVSSRPISSVSIKTFPYLTLFDKNIARDYAVTADDNPAKLCFFNANTAREHQRYDHERFWTILYRMFSPIVPIEMGMAMMEAKDEKSEMDTYLQDRAHGRMMDGMHHVVRWGLHPLAKQMVQGFYDYFSQTKDVQMLAMLSLVLLEVDRITPRPKKSTPFEPRKDVPMAPVHAAPPANPRFSIDYFSLRLRDPALQTSGNASPPWSRLSSLAASSSLSLSFSPARNSWTSNLLPKTLLGAGSNSSTTVRDSAVTLPAVNNNPHRSRTVSSATVVSVGTPEGSRTPLTASASLIDISSRSIPVPAGRVATPESPKKKSSLLLGRSTEQLSNPLKAWGSEPSATMSSKLNIGFGSGGYGFNKRWTLTGSGSSKATSPIREKKKVISVMMNPDEEVES